MYNNVGQIKADFTCGPLVAGPDRSFLCGDCDHAQVCMYSAIYNEYISRINEAVKDADEMADKLFVTRAFHTCPHWTPIGEKELKSL